jgi:hypothetical protein
VGTEGTEGTDVAEALDGIVGADNNKESRRQLKHCLHVSFLQKVMRANSYVSVIGKSSLHHIAAIHRS